MSINRKKAPVRLAGLLPRVEEHLEKIAANPENTSVSHWEHEVLDWLKQMEDMIPCVGKKTAAEWTERIDVWRKQVEG